MTNMEEWDKFLENLHSNAISAHKNSKEYEYQKQRQEQQIDEFLSTNLSGDQKYLVDELLLELGLAHEREAEIIYRQGMKDSVWLLKNLGVLA